MRETRFWAAALACLVAPVFPAAAEEQPSPAASPRTVVTLGFDDGRSTQFDVLPLLAELGLRASFFANSGSIGVKGYMDQAALTQVQSAGHEFGGHTVDHEVLPGLPPEEVVRQVCDDRAALDAAGLEPLVSFAYPGGATTPEVAAVVASCGYRYGWAQGGLDDATCTDGCIYAEPLDPPDPLRLRSPRSVNQDWTLEELQGFVLRAETSGGWLGLSFHHICDDCTYTYRISPALLREFLAWLAARADRGTVVLPLGEAFVSPPPEPPPVIDPPNPLDPTPIDPKPVPPAVADRPASISSGCSSAGSSTAATGPAAILALLLLSRRRTAAGRRAAAPIRP